MMMYHTVVREELHDMIAWYIGLITDFQVSAGKMGKYFKNHLPPEMYKQYLETYSAAETADMWRAIGSACDLFSTLARRTGEGFGYSYNGQDEKNMRCYLLNVRNRVYAGAGARSHRESFSRFPRERAIIAMEFEQTRISMPKKQPDSGLDRGLKVLDACTPGCFAAKGDGVSDGNQAAAG